MIRYDVVFFGNKRLRFSQLSYQLKLITTRMTSDFHHPRALSLLLLHQPTTTSSNSTQWYARCWGVNNVHKHTEERMGYDLIQEGWCNRTVKWSIENAVQNTLIAKIHTLRVYWVVSWNWIVTIFGWMNMK